MADFGDQSDTLDEGQIIKAVYDKPKIALRVYGIDGLVPEDYDAYEVSFITSGNGIGDVGLLTFKKNAAIVAAISFTYDSQHRFLSAERV